MMTYWFSLQVDNEYRAVWDQFVLKLDVVDLDPMSGSEVLHWVTKFPVSIYLHVIQWNIYIGDILYSWCLPGCIGVESRNSLITTSFA